MIALKKKRELYFCVYYQKMRAISKQDSDHLPHPKKFIDSRTEATMLYTMDATSDYWQVEAEISNVDKTAFTSHLGIDKFMQLPIRSKSDPETSRQAISIILYMVMWQFAPACPDNNAVY